METTAILLAKFWGWYLIIFCGLLLVNTKRVVQLIAIMEDEKYLVLTSFIAITFGLVSIVLHNVWELNWKLIISLLGWTSLVKGVINFTFPKTSIKALNQMNIRYLPMVYGAFFLLGMVLLNQAYQIVLY